MAATPGDSAGSATVMPMPDKSIGAGPSLAATDDDDDDEFAGDMAETEEEDAAAGEGEGGRNEAAKLDDIDKGSVAPSSQKQN